MSEIEDSRPAYTLFDTELGRCGIVWKRSSTKNTIAVIGFQLPEATSSQAEAQIVGKWNANRADRIPPLIADIINRVELHFKGRIQDFRDTELELDGVSPFFGRIYQAAREVQAGRISSYGELATAAGHAEAARAVGMAMSKNPVPLIIPCHRILAAGLKPGGFSANGGLDTKAKMLLIEGVTWARPASIRNGKDLSKAAALLKDQDPRLAFLLSKPLAFSAKPANSPYRTLAEAVVHQQLSPSAAKTILQRLTALYGGLELPDPDQLIDTPDEQLYSVGLSRSKAKSLKDIAAKALDGTVPPAKAMALLTDEAIIRCLTPIYGVGRWTVEMMLIFNLGRLDVFPADDYALRKSMAAVLGLEAVPTANQAMCLSEVWRPYRTVASLYFWAVGNGDIPPS